MLLNEKPLLIRVVNQDEPDPKKRLLYSCLECQGFNFDVNMFPLIFACKRVIGRKVDVNIYFSGLEFYKQFEDDLKMDKETIDEMTKVMTGVMVDAKKKNFVAAVGMTGVIHYVYIPAITHIMEYVHKEFKVDVLLVSFACGDVVEFRVSDNDNFMNALGIGVKKNVVQLETD